MGNSASGVGDGRGKKKASVAGKGPNGSVAMIDDSIVSNSHKEETEARVQNTKGLGLLVTGRYDEAVAAFDESLKFRFV
jgi:hypothetical protein